MNVRKAIKNTAIGAGVLTGLVLLTTQDALVARMHPRYVYGTVTSIICESHNLQGLPPYTDYKVALSGTDGFAKTFYTQEAFGPQLAHDIWEKSYDNHIKVKLGFFDDEQDKHFKINSLDQVEYPSQAEWDSLVASSKSKK